jgi:hypothetical protein
MKKYLVLVLLGLMTACDDGDLQIETIDFDTITTVGSCSTISASTANVLFKINQDEALILELPNGLLQNEATTEALVSNVPGNSQITYRIFSGNVSNAYFCDAVPPLEPLVTEEIQAEGGQILVTSLLNADATGYEHTIRLSGVTFVLGDGSRITDLQINEFGTVTTSL